MIFNTIAELLYRCVRALEEGINLQSTTVVLCGTRRCPLPNGKFVGYSFSENTTSKVHSVVNYLKNSWTKGEYKTLSS